MEKDIQKIVECLKACATGSFKVCKACPYRNRCNDLIADAIELLEGGCDLLKEVHPMRNNPEENKRIVQEGLDRRKAERMYAENEARLEQYERDMIRACNKRHADAKIENMAVTADHSCKAQSRARIVSRRDAKYRKMERNNSARHAVMLYVFVIAGLFWLTTWTYMPVWTAATCMVSFLPILLVHLFQLYNPAKKCREVS